MTLKLVFDAETPPDYGSFGLPARTMRNRQEHRALNWQTFECESCGDEIPMTDDLAELFRELSYTGRRIVCSACAEAERQERKQRRDYAAHQPVAEVPWSCDFCPAIVECNGDCWRLADQPAKPPAKSKSQMELFNG